MPSVDEADELAAAVTQAVVRLLDVIERRPPDGGHVLAHHVLLEAAAGIRNAFCQAAGPDRERRADVLQLLAVFVDEIHAIAPIAAQRLLDPEPSVRLGAARLIRGLTEPPAVARTARQSAEHHPDSGVRTALK